MTVAAGTGPAGSSAQETAKGNKARDIASVVAFLLSQDAGWMTGQVLVVDGGVTITDVGE